MSVVAAMLARAAFAQRFEGATRIDNPGERAAALWLYPLPQFERGVEYWQGRGVPQDHAEAVNWYRKAADQGYAPAQNNLGVAYRDGLGLPRDSVQAYKWFSLAESRSPTKDAEARAEAVKNRDAIAASMTLAQIGEAQKLAREWRPIGQPLLTAAPPVEPSVITPPSAGTRPSPTPATHRDIVRLSGETPIYPRAAIRRGFESGKVVTQIMVDEMGNVSEIIIVNAEPPSHFDQAVLDALKGWKYRADGTRYIVELEIKFKIDWPTQSQ